MFRRKLQTQFQFLFTSYSLFTKKEPSSNMPIYQRPKNTRKNLYIKTLIFNIVKIVQSIDSISFFNFFLKIVKAPCKFFFFFLWTSAYIYLARRKIQSHRIQSVGERNLNARVSLSVNGVSIFTPRRDRGAKLDLALRRRE